MLKVLFTLFFIFSLINISYGNEIDCKYIKENQATKQVLDDYNNQILQHKNSEDIKFDLLKYLFSNDKEKFILNSLPYSKFESTFTGWFFNVKIIFIWLEYNKNYEEIYNFNISGNCWGHTCSFSYILNQNLENTKLSELDREILRLINDTFKDSISLQNKHFKNIIKDREYIINITNDYHDYLSKTTFKNIYNNYYITWNNVDKINKEYVEYLDNIEVFDEYQVPEISFIERINLSIIQECSNSNNIISNDWEKNSKINYYIIIIILWVIILLIYFRKKIFNFKKD